MENNSETLSPHVATLLGILYFHRRAISIVAVLSVVLSVIVSLLLPKYYLGTARVLLPEGSASGTLTAILGDLAPTASALIGSPGGGDFDRFRAILSSRTVLLEIVDEFDLLEVYELTDSSTPQSDVLETLAARTEFAIDAETGYMSIEVLDRSPERAAEMANRLVELLNDRNSDLLAESAKQYRIFMAQMLAENEARLDSARAIQQSFQSKFGIIDLPAQTAAFFEGLAALRTEVLKARIEYEATNSRLGSENTSTRNAQSVFAAASRSYREALNGSEAVLPVSQDSMAAVARTYAEVTQEVIVQQELFKFLRPLYEQARFDEQRTKTAVQVMDRATTPERKDRPKRAVIVVSATMSVVFLFIMAILFRHWVRNYGSTTMQQIKRVSRA